MTKTLPLNTVTSFDVILTSGQGAPGAGTVVARHPAARRLPPGARSRPRGASLRRAVPAVRRFPEVREGSGAPGRLWGKQTSTRRAHMYRAKLTPLAALA